MSLVFLDAIIVYNTGFTVKDLSTDDIFIVCKSYNIESEKLFHFYF